MKYMSLNVFLVLRKERERHIILLVYIYSHVRIGFEMNIQIDQSSSRIRDIFKEIIFSYLCKYKKSMIFIM